MIILCYKIDERAVYCILYFQKRGMNGGSKCEINVSDVLFSPFPEKKPRLIAGYVSVNPIGQPKRTRYPYNMKFSRHNNFANFAIPKKIAKFS